jgi:hypothetical protein
MTGISGCCPVSAAMQRVRFLITIEGLASNENTNIHQLRLLLKRLLRWAQLRCVDVRQIDASRNGFSVYRNKGSEQ